MSRRIEELDWQQTPIGAISLRRRYDPLLKAEVYEIKLDDDFLMSSVFTVAEIELARLGLAGLDFGPTPLDVVVGGLGLGATALAALEDERVGSLIVVEALAAVIGWHERGLVPAGGQLTADPRCRFVRGDFFALAAAALDPQAPGRRFHAIIVDIDHAPDHVLHPSHAAFYEPAGLRRVADQLHPGGCFALWSNDPPQGSFLASLGEVFADAHAEVVSFPNPLQDRPASNTVYIGHTRSDRLAEGAPVPGPLH